MNKKVLIIDDDLEVCKQVKDHLQNETTKVYSAESVKDALLFLMKNTCNEKLALAGYYDFPVQYERLRKLH